jgi:hypothetical protein
VFFAGLIGLAAMPLDAGRRSYALAFLSGCTDLAAVLVGGRRSPGPQQPPKKRAAVVSSSAGTPSATGRRSAGTAGPTPNSSSPRSSTPRSPRRWLPGRDVVVDDTNLSVAAMDGLADVARRTGAPLVVRDVDTDVETCVRRDAARPAPTPGVRSPAGGSAPR